MAPIRVGMIGLSSTSKISWASTAHLPYLQASNGKYEITALCNSSVASAQASIQAFNLPSSTKTYGNPEDLANDPDIDLVVCNTRVDVHYETIKPSLLKGKNVYCEYPLGANLEQAQELYDISKEKNVRTMVGLQGQMSPLWLKVKSLIDEGRIGKVLSSHVVAYGGMPPRDATPEAVKYFMQREVGGNFVTISFAHLMNMIASVLGELSSFRAQTSILRPTLPIISASGKVIETLPTDVPDHIMLHGTLLSSGAPLSFTMRRGQPFKDSKAITVYINGEKGEIRVTVRGLLMLADDDEVNIVVHDFAKDVLEEVQWTRHFTHVPDVGRNVAAMYEGYYAATAAAEGAGGEEGGKKNYSCPDFGNAVLRQTMVERVFGSGEEDARVSYV